MHYSVSHAILSCMAPCPFLICRPCGCKDKCAGACAGRVKVTDVMFPGGSPDLVEPIYKNPKLSAPFNEQLAAAVRAYTEERLQVRSLALTLLFTALHHAS